ncbi:MAG TPA: prephenate dehydratase [Verrucomicrobiales bacterium]|nr:prephenate dehydratase [Verrucomicrobiales bacterium]
MEKTKPNTRTLKKRQAPKSIPQLRKAIDRLDEQIVELLNHRTEHVLKIGAAKLKKGEEIYAPHREIALLDRLCRLNSGPITNDSVKAIYREVMSSAISLQKSMTIAYLGPSATYTHQAAIKRFGSSLGYAPQKTIGDVFSEVEKNRADYGVVPIENSTEGVVNHTLDMFVDSELKIVAQIVLPIDHCLVKKQKNGVIKRLYTHPQALAQCRGWLEQNLPGVETIESSSTTRAAEKASKERGSAAIASSLAAEQCGLQILESGIQDNRSNATRFLVLGRRCSPQTGNDRTSIMFGLADRAGALHNSLSPFRSLKLNLTKIESRPNKKKAWEYFFFVDLEGHAEDEPVKKALEKLGKHCLFVKVLGSYPNME